MNHVKPQKSPCLTAIAAMVAEERGGGWLSGCAVEGVQAILATYKWMFGPCE
jgi:hypothetical protein